MAVDWKLDTDDSAALGKTTSATKSATAAPSSTWMRRAASMASSAALGGPCSGASSDNSTRNSEARLPNAPSGKVEGHLNRAQELLKTPLYRSFETAIVEAFQEQVRLTTHQVQFDFRTFDPLNFYKGLHPILIEDGEHRNPSEAGSGMRNLIVMALFRAYAKAFRGDAIIAMEEPEIYLHPHAQRSLAALFEELAAQGAQILYSTHSAAFIDVARADRVIFVKRCKDEEEEVCTQVRNVSADALLRDRKRLYPGIPITVESMQERYRNICGPEHAEAFFARAVLIVEGPTETAALPIYAKHLDVDFDALGISVVSAGGKGNADQLFQLYETLGFPTYLVFDNDRGGNSSDIDLNAVLTRMLGLKESKMPDGAVGAKYAIIEGNFEKTVKRDLEVVESGLYDTLRREAEAYLGSNAGKALIARFMARRLVERDTVPATVRQAIEAVKALVAAEDEHTAEDNDIPPGDRYKPPPWDDEEVPF